MKQPRAPRKRPEAAQTLLETTPSPLTAPGVESAEVEPLPLQALAPPHHVPDPDTRTIDLYSAHAQSPEHSQKPVAAHTSTPDTGTRPFMQTASTPSRELFQALFWLARLLHFRVTAQADGEEDPSLGLTDLVTELAAACEVPVPLLNAPPPLPEEGWQPTLCALFGLSSMEGLLVATALAPTVDGRFAQAFGRFMNANRPEKASSDLLARLLAFTLPERARLGAMLRVGNPLERFGLLQLDWGDNALLPLNFQPLNISDRLRWYLLEDAREFPPPLQRIMTLHVPNLTLDQSPLETPIKQRLRDALVELRRLQAEGIPAPVVSLEGPWGAGQREIAAVLATGLGLTVLEINIAPWLHGLEPANIPMLLRREALLQNAVLLIRAQSEEPQQDLLQLKTNQLLDLDLKEVSAPIIVSGNLATLAGMRDLRRATIRYELRLPDRKLQLQGLELALKTEHVTASRTALEDLLNRYNLDLTSTQEVIHTAISLARSQRNHPTGLETLELETAVEMILRRHLGELSQRLSARHVWEDLVLSHEIVDQLKTLRHLIEHRHLVFETWGMGRKSSGGRGIKALFSGPSGTGKTMSAEVIASDLRLPLYRVDLSSVVSKWVGETEKNLEKIFREAQGSQAILLFDEADALFGKRGNVENANDRHANLEVSFLLQRFEVHDGVVILTTNFPTVIDTAFARRMQFVIEYESPDEPTRRILWQKQLVPTLPTTNDIDIPFLAQRFEISGANIRNVVMAAAFLAAAGNCPVGMQQIAKAMQWEYQKLGRSVSTSDFGRFFRPK